MPRKRSRRKRIDADALRQKKYKTSYVDAFKPKKKKQFWIVIVLIGIFCLVLFFNSYFNYTAGTAFNPDGDTLGTRFYLSGPDPYYNMRTCEQSLEQGRYVFTTDSDDLLNYPLGHPFSSRPPLFNMIAMGSAKLLGNFMSEMDALGWSMLFLPAIYGALLVFPVYGIGKKIFNKKVGLLAAFFVAIIPIHLSGGHGSAFSLFDHDSFVLLLTATVAFFVISALKEEDTKKSILYGTMAGVFIGAIELTWVSGEFIYAILITFLVVQLFFDLLKKQTNIKNYYAITTALFVGFMIALPYSMLKAHLFDMPLMAFVGAIIVTMAFYFINKFKLPWIISIPSLFATAGIGVTTLYLESIGVVAIGGPVRQLSGILFGAGIYGSEVSLTIAEAHTFPLSQSVMSFGPALYWVALAGFVLFMYKTFKEKFKSYHVFLIIIFLTNFWLASTAGRFLNDMIPTMVVFAAFLIWRIVDKIDYKQMIRNIKSIGGFRGIRRGIKLGHMFGILFICFLVILPNTLLALDAATPPEMDAEVFGEGFVGAFGNSLGGQAFWADACHWLSLQDTEIKEPEDRPAIISWWDYGFYIASMARHPTVADNYQDGIPPASHFHTAQTEEEATAILIIRLAEGKKNPVRTPIGKLPNDIKQIFKEYFGNESVNLTNIIEDPVKYAPSYNQLVTPEYGNNVLRISDYNSMYQDAIDIITTLNDEQITQLYMDIMETTNTSIRYYAIDSRDLTSIFGVFPFLADRGFHGFLGAEDDFFITAYRDRNTNKLYTEKQLNNMSSEELNDMDLSPETSRKQGYYNCMIYKAFYGYNPGDGTLPTNRIPGYFLRHWYLAYVTPYITILKYYEGAIINGQFNSSEFNNTMVIAFDEYQIAHDSRLVLDNNMFSILAPAGNVTLKVFETNGNETGYEKTIYVTEEQAKRQVPYENIIKIGD